MKLKCRLQRMMNMCLLLAGIANLSSCMVTNKVLDLRKERETRTKEATNFWSLAAVRSAHATPDGEMFVCVEFRDSPADEPQAYTINLSRTSQIGKTYADLMPPSSTVTEGPPSAEARADMAWYLYPLREATKGCGRAAETSPAAAKALKVETVRMQGGDQARLPTILMAPEHGAANVDRVVEVSLAAPDQASSVQPGPAKTKTMMLVYLPAAVAGEKARVFGVAGAFEPGSEWLNPYTLLVAPAVAADTFIIMLAIMAHGGGT